MARSESSAAKFTGRICMHVLQRKGSFGPDANHLSEKLAVEVFQKIDHIAKRGQKAYVASTQQMTHYDTIVIAFFHYTTPSPC